MFFPCQAMNGQIGSGIIARRKEKDKSPFAPIARRLKIDFIEWS